MSNNNNGTAVERRNGSVPANGRGKPTIKMLLEGPQFKTAVEQSLPRHLKPERFVRVAMSAMSRTPKLQNCTQESLFKALLTLSQLGLEPDGRLAHLIPYGTECQLVLDYKGIVDLAYRGGQISYLHADVVCENDEFEYDRGLVSRHKPNLRGDRGEVYAVYSVARFKDGGEKAEVMNRDEVERIRRGSKSANSGPWRDHWNEMAKKTVFKRLSKWLPLSSEIRDAMDADEDDFANAAGPARPSVADRLSSASDAEGRLLIAPPDDGAGGEDVDELTGEVIDPPDTSATDARLAEWVAAADGRGFSPRASRAVLDMLLDKAGLADAGDADEAVWAKWGAMLADGKYDAWLRGGAANTGESTVESTGHDDAPAAVETAENAAARFGEALDAADAGLTDEGVSDVWSKWLASIGFVEGDDVPEAELKSLLAAVAEGRLDFSAGRVKASTKRKAVAA